MSVITNSYERLEMFYIANPVMLWGNLQYGVINMCNQRYIHTNMYLPNKIFECIQTSGIFTSLYHKHDELKPAVATELTPFTAELTNCCV